MPEHTDTRKLRAILHVDVNGYSRLMGEDESSTATAFRECRKLFSARVEGHGGCIVNAPGDAVLAELPIILSAVRCAVAIQNDLRSKNADLPDHRKMAFRIGVSLGDVIHSPKS